MGVVIVTLVLSVHSTNRKDGYYSQTKFILCFGGEILSKFTCFFNLPGVIDNHGRLDDLIQIECVKSAVTL